jgi:hypothetical protein
VLLLSNCDRKIYFGSATIFAFSTLAPPLSRWERELKSIAVNDRLNFTQTLPSDFHEPLENPPRCKRKQAQNENEHPAFSCRRHHIQDFRKDRHVNGHEKKQQTKALWATSSREASPCLSLASSYWSQTLLKPAGACGYATWRHFSSALSASKPEMTSKSSSSMPLWRKR